MRFLQFIKSVKIVKYCCNVTFLLTFSFPYSILFDGFFFFLSTTKTTLKWIKFSIRIFTKLLFSIICVYFFSVCWDKVFCLHFLWYMDREMVKENISFAVWFFLAFRAFIMLFDFCPFCFLFVFCFVVCVWFWKKFLYRLKYQLTEWGDDKFQ